MLRRMTHALAKRRNAHVEGDLILPRAAAILAFADPPGPSHGLLENTSLPSNPGRRTATFFSYPRLKECDQATQRWVLHGELRSYLRWAQEVAGAHAPPKGNLARLAAKLESLPQRTPENYLLIGDLGQPISVRG